MTEESNPLFLAALCALAAYLMVVAGIGKRRLEWRRRRPPRATGRWRLRRNRTAHR